MQNQLLKYIFTAFLLLFISGYGMSQSVGKVRAIVGNLPLTMEAGSTHKVAVNITNNGKEEWSSEHLHGKADGKFEITKEWSTEWKLQPGETTQVYYKILAPSTSGKFRLKISIYNDNKKIGSESRRITVVDTNTPGNK